MSGGSDALLTAAMTCDLDSKAMDSAQAALLTFVQKVTDTSQFVDPADVETLRSLGWSDLQIAETIHLTALFAFFNRVVNAFGLPSQGMLAMARARSECCVSL